MKKFPISKWINSINKMEDDDVKYLSGYRIAGDGSGDFEKFSDCATEKALKEYIRNCEEQIAMAKNILTRSGVAEEE